MYGRNFQVSFEENELICSASRLERADQHPSSYMDVYTPSKMGDMTLMQWVEIIIRRSLPNL